MRSLMRGSLMWCSFVSTVCDPPTRRGSSPPVREKPPMRRSRSRARRYAEHAPRGADRTRRPAARTYRGGRSTRVEAGLLLHCNTVKVSLVTRQDIRSGAGGRSGTECPCARRSGARPGRVSGSWTPRTLMAPSTMPKAPTESMSGPPLGRGGVNTRGVCGAGVSVGRGLSGTGVSRAGGVKRRGPSGAGAPRMKGRSRRADGVRREAGAADASVPPAARACRRLRPPTRSRRNRPPNRNGR